MTQENEQITDAIRSMLTSNRGPDGQPAVYRVAAHGYEPSAGSFELSLGFRAGETYCCIESGCHFGFFDGKWFRRLADGLSSTGWSQPPPSRIRVVTVEVEQGVVLTVVPEEVEKPRSYEIGPFSAQESAG